MPANSIINGQPIWVPGVEVVSKVVSDLPGLTPNFVVPVVLGEAYEGHALGSPALQYSSETTLSPFYYSRTSTGVASYFGPSSDMAAAAAYAHKVPGYPGAYYCAINTLTRTSVIVTSTGPVNQFTLYARKFGAIGGWTKVKFASNIFTITPPKNYAFLSANASTGSKRMYFKGYKPIDWVREGMTVSVGDFTATQVESLVVDKKGSYPDSNGQLVWWVDFTTAPAAAYATADYGAIVEYDTKSEVSPACTTAQAAIDWLNSYSLILGAHVHADFTNAALIAVSSAVRMFELGATWGTMTAGTSVAQTTANWTTFATDFLATEHDAFIEQYGVMPRLVHALTSSSTNHATLRDLAATLRTAGKPIQVYTGCTYTDVFPTAGDDTDPTFRAGVLNSQDIYLCAGKVDRLHPYISLAGQVFGHKVAGGVGHNCTEDTLYKEGDVGKKWDEAVSGQLTRLHRLGVITYRLSSKSGTPRYVISQDINTLQVRTVVANTGTNDSGYGVWRLRQDYIEFVLASLTTDNSLGQDSIDRDALAASLLTRGDKILSRHLAAPLAITSITANSSGTGWDVTCNTQQPPLSDFFSIVVNAVS